MTAMMFGPYCVGVFEEFFCWNTFLDDGEEAVTNDGVNLMGKEGCRGRETKRRKCGGSMEVNWLRKDGNVKRSPDHVGRLWWRLSSL